MGIIIYATFFSSTIKRFWATKAVVNGKSVLGISVSSSSATTNSFKQEADLNFKSITHQVSQIKIGDIIKTINNGGKLIQGLTGYEKLIQSDLQKLSGQKNS